MGSCVLVLPLLYGEWVIVVLNKGSYKEQLGKFGFIEGRSIVSRAVGLSIGVFQVDVDGSYYYTI